MLPTPCQTEWDQPPNNLQKQQMLCFHPHHHYVIKNSFVPSIISCAEQPRVRRKIALIKHIDNSWENLKEALVLTRNTINASE
jgi:hypothetical protein